MASLQPNAGPRVPGRVPGAELWTEVRVSFAGTVVDVTHLRPGQSFTLGEEPAADLTYATPGLHRLVMATADGAVLARLGTGELVALGEDEWTRVELGALTIEVGCTPRLAAELGHQRIDVGWWLSLVSTSLVVVAFLTLTGIAADTQLPPLDSDAAPYLAYTVRSEPQAAEHRREQPARSLTIPPAPLEHTRRAPTKHRPDPRSEPNEASATSSEPGPQDIRLAMRQRPGPRSVAPALQRDSDPVEAARSAGILGVLDESGVSEGAGAMIAIAATHFSPDVDDRELWAAMTERTPTFSVGGLELVGSGRGGGIASEMAQTGAAPRPQLDTPAQLAKCRGSACERTRELSGMRVVETQVDGSLDAALALRFANSLREDWAECLRGEDVEAFEVHYGVLASGRIDWAKIPATQPSSKLSSKSRRCIIAAIETHGSGPGATEDGRAANIAQRIDLRR